MELYCTIYTHRMEAKVVQHVDQSPCLSIYRLTATSSQCLHGSHHALFNSALTPLYLDSTTKRSQLSYYKDPVKPDNRCAAHAPFCPTAPPHRCHANLTTGLGHLMHAHIVCCQRSRAFRSLQFGLAIPSLQRNTDLIPDQIHLKLIQFG